MSGIAVTAIGNLGRDMERKGTNEKAPYRSSVAASNSLTALDKKSKKGLFKNLVVWPGTDAFRMIQAMENAGKPLKKGDNLIFMGTLKGEEYTPEGSDRTAIGEFIEVDRIMFNSSGSKKTSDGSASSSSGSSSSRPAAPAAQPADEEVPGGGIGAGVLDL
jgi:single-stranded DNA-binding protein